MQTLIGPRVQSYLKNSDAYKAFKLNSTKRWYVEGLEGFPLAQAVLLYSRNLAGRIWVICPTEDSAAALFKDIAASGALCQLLPSSGKQLYSEWEGTHREYEQLKVLGIITEEPKTIVITSLRAFVSPMVDISALRATAVELKVNDRFDSASIAKTNGRRRLFQIAEHDDAGRIFYPWRGVRCLWI